MSDVPQRLRALRARYALSQVRLARYMGVSGVTVNRWENGAVRPSPWALEKLELAERLGVDRLGDREAQESPPSEPIVNISAPVEIDFGGDPEDVRLVVEAERLSF